MKNTKKIKNGTILTVVWFNGAIRKYTYDSNSGLFLREEDYSLWHKPLRTIQDIIDYTHLGGVGLVVESELGIIAQYGIQEPPFKY